MAQPVSEAYADFMAEYYDHVPLYAGRADVKFYVECAQEGFGRVLELGCGTGRILIPTAAAGCDITGIDLSRAMLAKCREKLEKQPADVRERVRLREGTMTELTLPEQFALVTMPFRGFQHLLRVEDQMKCLEGIHRHLTDRGRLIFDVFQVVPQAMFDPTWMREREDTPWTPLGDGRKFRRTHRVTGFHRAEQYNDVEFINYVMHPDGREERRTQNFPFRYFFPFEVQHLLARCGFKIRKLYGNYDRSELRDESPDMVFVAEKA